MSGDGSPCAVDSVALLRRYADHPSAFLALNSGTERRAGRAAEGLVAYRVWGRGVVQFGAAFAGAEERGVLLDELRGERPGLVAVQLRSADLALYAERGFTVNQLGSGYGIDLGRFTLRGKPLAKVRQNVSRARREGVVVHEADASDTARLDAIDAAWLRAKGRYAKELGFLVGERGGAGAPYRRTFLAEHDGRTVGYATYAPAWGGRAGWLYDLTRRTPDAPVGTTELINLTALERFQAEGAGWLHLGFTPFAGLTPKLEHPTYSRTLARTFRLVRSARAQAAFKRKWAPHVVDPEYVAFERGARPAAVGNLLRLTGAL